MKASFGAVVDARTRVLILGSLPGDRSLAERQYYAHPTNRFWDLTGAVIDRDLRALGYAERLAALGEAGIGLWDSIATARRTGSLDSAIREHQYNDLAGLIASLSGLRCIAFNGGMSAKVGRAQLPRCMVAMIDLPSSSAANAGQTLAAKRTRWLELRAFL